MSKINKADFLASLKFLAGWRVEMGYFPEITGAETWEEEAVAFLRIQTLSIAANFKLDGDAMNDLMIVRDEKK